MGGKKDGVLRRFLTDNKKAILENMTTTYLMTAFPAACIQYMTIVVYDNHYLQLCVQGATLDQHFVATLWSPFTNIVTIIFYIL